MPATDVMLADLERESDNASRFIDDLVEGARTEGRDLNDNELALIARHREVLTRTQAQMIPLREAAKVQEDSRRMHADLASDAARRAERLDRARNERNGGGNGRPIEYRSAGAYILDLWRGSNGDEDARNRVDMFNRVAAHQTTSDNPGLLPEQIVAPVVNRVDVARPIVAAIGPTDLGQGSWAYAKVTQHTSVAAQSAEKAELASQKMTITKTSITPVTYGGYVNVSKQDIQRTTPQILDMVIDDLAAQYAIVTENVCADDLTTGATAGSNTAITSSSDADAINAALWTVAATAYTNMKGAGRLFLAVSPDLLGVFGKVFVPVNPSNAASSGFAAGDFGQGIMGSISGIPVVMSAGLNTNTALLINTAAVRVFEYRYGNLQVAEPSVWGVQVGYAGDFETVITDAGGVIQVDTTA